MEYSTLPIFGALLIFTEHHYYGESLPNLNKSSEHAEEMTGKKRKFNDVDKSCSLASAKRKFQKDETKEENDESDTSDSEDDDNSLIKVKIINTDLFDIPNENDVIATGTIRVTQGETVSSIRNKIMNFIHECFPQHAGGFEFINLLPSLEPWRPAMLQFNMQCLPSLFKIEVIYIRLTPKNDLLNPGISSSNQTWYSSVECVDEDNHDTGRSTEPNRSGISWRTNSEDPMGILTELINKNFKGFVGIHQLREKARKIAEDAYFNWLENLPRRHPGHIVIVGNPGVGKTTGAIALANFLAEADVVLSDNIVEAHRDDLVDKYVGGTEMKTNDVIQSAHGGVVIFDEIYTLHKPTSPNDTGKEALTTIMKHMTDDCSPVFMFLGYKEHMKDFVNMNPGFRRRIRYTIEMKDYSWEDLGRIVIMKLKERPDVQMEAELSFERYFRDLPQSYLQLHNASVAIRLIDYALDSARERVLALHYMNRRGATVLKQEDFEVAFRRIKKESEDADGNVPPNFAMYL